MKLLENKVAIVTGAGSGIGREIAYKFADEGAKVVVSDMNEQAGRETAGVIADKKGASFFVKADASIPKECEMLVEQAQKKFGQLNVSVNNAGIGGPSAPVGDYPIEGWDKVLSVNLSGVFYGMRYQIPAILKAGGGSIVNIASVLGQVGFENSAAYVAAKHGVLGLTQNAALEYGPKKIRINSVGPGFIKTPLLEKNMTDDARAALVKLHPMGRLGESAEVAELVLWLSSDKASFVTGSYYAVDGGYLAR